MKSTKKSILLVVSLLLVAALVAACSATSTPGAPASDPRQTMRRSPFRIYNRSALAEKLAEAFMTENTGLRIDVQGGGSSVGVKAAGQATSDIGMASGKSRNLSWLNFPTSKSLSLPAMALQSLPTRMCLSAI